MLIKIIQIVFIVKFAYVNFSLVFLRFYVHFEEC
jgi:hypothetical protein